MEEKNEMNEAIDAVKEADRVAERMEAANKKKEELLAREEAINARSGSTNGAIKKEKEKDPLDDPVAYSKAVFAGQENPLK